MTKYWYILLTVAFLVLTILSCINRNLESARFDIIMGMLCAIMAKLEVFKGD